MLPHARLLTKLPHHPSALDVCHLTRPRDESGSWNWEIGGQTIFHLNPRPLTGPLRPGVRVNRPTLVNDVDERHRARCGEYRLLHADNLCFYLVHGDANVRERGGRWTWEVGRPPSAAPAPPLALRPPPRAVAPASGPAYMYDGETPYRSTLYSTLNVRD